MQVTKENRFFMYKGKEGRFQIYANVDGKQISMTAFPNVDDDLKVKDWSGNVRDNTTEE